jgi:adhesin transport system membrane fusion protein
VVSTKISKRKLRQQNLDLVTDIRTTILIESPRGGRSIIWLTLILFGCALWWASVSEVDEVTRGLGKVIPSSQVQIVQNLEGGILAETFVNIGDIVQKGQLLMRLDEKRFSAPYQEYRYKYLALTAKAARLTAETDGVEMVLPAEVEKENSSIAAREWQLYTSRKSQLQTTIEILEEKAKQRRQDLAELEEKKTELLRTYQLLKREIELTEPLIAQGAVSEVEILRLKREASTMLGDIAATKLAIPRVTSQLNEAMKEIKEEQLQFANSAKKELNEVQAELDTLTATSVALADRLERTSIRSPVYGTVKQILVNTVGGVIQPGMDLIEIVPLEDTLLVEAQIKPSDIAFLRPDQKAMVKFTAYDFTIYGGLEADLEHISADSITDEKGNSFYQVRVRTTQNYLQGKAGEKMPIIPGMVATVDILTGKKTILSYLLKPMLKAKQTALRER